MKIKRILFFIVIMFLANSVMNAERKLSKEEQAVIDEYSGDYEHFGNLSDDQLVVLLNYGTKEDHDEADSLLSYRRQKELLLNQLKKLATALNSVPDNIPETSVKNDIINRQNEIKATLSRLEVQEKIAQNDRIKKSNDERELKKAQKAGDPVKMTNGSYEQTSVDISCGSILPVEIKRHYSSDSQIISSFGFGWSTNLDERIILGIDGTARTLYEKSKQYQDYLYENINNLRNSIRSQYKITNIDDYENEINNMFNPLINQYSDAEALAKKLALSAEEKSARTHKVGLQNKKQKALEILTQDVPYLHTLETEYEKTTRITQNYYNLKTRSEDRHYKNRKVLFSGTDSSYEQTGLDTLSFVDEEGYPHLLYETQSNSGIWKNENDKSIVECSSTQNGYCIKLPDGSSKEFDNLGLLIKITDRNSNSILISRDSSEQIKSISNSFGESFKLTYKNNFINQIINLRDQKEKISFGYSGNNLTSVTDSDGDLLQIEYDINGRMTCSKNCDGSFVQFIYGEITNAHKPLVTQTINEEGYSEYFYYDIAAGRTTYKDHDGNQTVYYFDSHHRTISEHQPNGTTVINEYDSQGNLTKTTTNGNITFYSYDNLGNLTCTTYSDGSTEKFGYDTFKLQTYYKDRNNTVYEYIRDSKGNLIEYKTGGKIVYTQGFNNKGQLIKKTEYGDKPIVTEYEYDTFGNCICKTIGSLKTNYEFDSQNRITKVLQNQSLYNQIKYNGKITTKTDFNSLETTYITNGRNDITQIIQKDMQTGVVHKTRIEYDKRHLPLKIYAGDGEAEILINEYTYTPEGKIKSETVVAKQDEGQNLTKLYEYKNGQIWKAHIFAAQNPSEDTITYEYDYQNKNNNEKLLTITNPLGAETLFEYDSWGNLKKQTDANGQVTQTVWSNGSRISKTQNPYGGYYEYEYDNAGFVSKEREENSKASVTTYNPNGNIKSQSNKYGVTTNYSYDNCGRLTCEQNVAGCIWYEYDNLGRLTKKTIGSTSAPAATIYFVSYEYSDDNRTITITEGGKYKTINIVDAFGNLIKQTDGNGNTKKFEYDFLNNLVSATDCYDNKTTYEYNALGLVEKIILPDGAATNYKYNTFGQMVKITDARGTVYQAEYDKAGRLIKEKSRNDSEKSYEYDDCDRITKILCGGQTVESYTYEQNGSKLTVTDGNGSKYFYNYDLFGRLSNEKNRLNLSQNYFYDDEGQLKKQDTFDGTSNEIFWSNNFTTRTVQYSDGSKNIFTYNAIGNIIEAQNDYSKTKYEYDQGGRLVLQKELTTDEEIRFEYDAAGNRILLVSSNKETHYSYDANNNLKEIFDNKQRVSVKLDYDKNGREILRKYGNGITEQTRYDKAGRVTLKYQKNSSGEILWGEGYIYGKDGKRTATVDINAKVTLYEYDNQGRLSAVYYPYTKEHEDLIKTEAKTNGLSSTELSANGQLGINRYFSTNEKAELSARLNEIQYTLAYALNTMQIFIKESYSYDKNGNRISKETPLGKIEYFYDKENRLVSSGSRGQTFVTYSYDKAGNLLSEESSYKTIKYAYNLQNRLIYCEVTDKSELTFTRTKYAYDAFGRRIAVQDFDETTLQTVYDGLTFDAIKQGPTFKNGTFTDAYQTGIRWTSAGQPNGERYRYITDETANDNSRYLFLDEQTYKAVSNRYSGERTQFTINGKIGAQITSDSGIEYFTTDSYGSVKATTDSYGSQKQTYTYDAFGSLIQGDLSGSSDLGYLGKTYDPTASLYNYGYRDYNPTAARFTTPDPIRDGPNWFTYCHGDPINFVDLWGLCGTSANDMSAYITFIIYRDDESWKSTDDYSYRGRDTIVFKNTKTNDTFTLSNVQSYVSHSKYSADNTLQSYAGGFTIQYLGDNQSYGQELYNQFGSKFMGPVFNVQNAKTKGGGVTNEYGEISDAEDKDPIRVHSDYNLDEDRTVNKASGGCPMYDNEQANDFSHFLKRNGVQPGDTIRGYIKEYYEP